MKYYDLPAATYKKEQVSEEELWSAFSWLFHRSAANDTSYKFIFFSALLDCLSYGSLRISFDILYERFCYYSWPLVVKYKIQQKATASDGRKTELENAMNAFFDQTCNGEYVSWNKLYEEDKKRLVKQVKKACKKYVVGAFFGDTKELCYSFSRKEEWIKLNPQMVQFLENNSKLLFNVNYNKWSKFYSNINQGELEEKLQNEIDPSIIRKGENVYRAILAKEYEMVISKENSAYRRVNTLEFLFEAESLENDVEPVDQVEMEEELYKDFEGMTEYLKDPILLIRYLKEKKGIANL